MRREKSYKVWPTGQQNQEQEIKPKFFSPSPCCNRLVGEIRILQKKLISVLLSACLEHAEPWHTWELFQLLDFTLLC